METTKFSFLAMHWKTIIILWLITCVCWVLKTKQKKQIVPFSPFRLSMQLSRWLPDPKAKWLRTIWMFSKISGRNRYASWPRLWMTSPLWMTSCPCRVGSSVAKWTCLSRIRKHHQKSTPCDSFVLLFCFFFFQKRTTFLKMSTNV